MLIAVVIVFPREMGDKTQLATVALGARYHSMVAVTAGTMLADGLAVFAGTTLTRVLPMARLRLIAALLFFAFGERRAAKLTFIVTLCFSYLWMSARRALGGRPQVTHILWVSRKPSPRYGGGVSVARIENAHVDKGLTIYYTLLR